MYAHRSLFLTFCFFFYLGICLPRNILDLFPEHSHSYGGTNVSRYIREIETLESNNNLSISSILGFKNQYQAEGDLATEVATIPDESAVSSMSDLSTAMGVKRVRKKTILSSIPFDQAVGLETGDNPTMVRSMSSNAGGGAGATKHNRSECILCCRSKVISKLIDTSLNIQEPKENLMSMNGKIGDSEISFYSPESIVSDDSANTNMPDRISNVILRNCLKMSNPILFKNCRKVLMELKQKYPQSFQDICLYSEVCKGMSSCSYRMTVRRFIQEIFLDLNYEQLATVNDTDLIINKSRQRLADLKLLDSSKSFPTSPSVSSSSNIIAPSTSSVQFSQSSLQQNQQQQAAPSHGKVNSLKSPLLASVYETSIENLIDSQPLKVEEDVDQVDSVVLVREKKSSPTKASQQVMAEVHNYRHSNVEPSTTSKNVSDIDGSSETLHPIRRRRINTFELDLSCTKNKFPIRHHHRTHDAPGASTTIVFEGPLATSTIQRQRHVSSSTSANITQSSETQIKVSSSSSSSLQLTSPLSPPPLGTLYCEQRLLQSRSEATLSTSTNNNENNKNMMMKRDDDKNEELR